MQQEWTRRRFLKVGWLVLLAASTLSFRPLTEYLASNEDSVQSPLVSFKGNVPDNGIWENIPQTRVWVRREKSHYAAVLATCTHMGCEVKYYPSKKQWLCPCHGSVYDEEGRPIKGPAPRALARLEIQIKPDGTLLVNTAKTI